MTTAKRKAVNDRPWKKKRQRTESAAAVDVLVRRVETGRPAAQVAAARTLRHCLRTRGGALLGALNKEHAFFMSIARAYIRAQDATAQRALIALLDAFLAVGLKPRSLQGLARSFAPRRRARLYRVLRMVVQRGVNVDSVGLVTGHTLLAHMMARPDIGPDDLRTLLELGARLDESAMLFYVQGHATLSADILNVARRTQFRFKKNVWRHQFDDSTRRVLLRHRLNPIGDEWATDYARITRDIRARPLNYWQYKHDGTHRNAKFDNVLSNARRAHFRGRDSRLAGYPVFKRVTSRYTKHLNTAMARYFKYKTLRAPEQPSSVNDGVRGHDPTRSIATLWRGMTVPAEFLQRMRHDGVLLDPSYMAFTHRESTALAYASQTSTTCSKKVVLEVNVNDIPRGTPWVWLSSLRGYGWTKPTEDWIYREGEVLLPPGAIEFKSWTERNGIAWVKARYAPNEFAVELPPNEPHPRYRPKPFAGPLLRRSVPTSPPRVVQDMYRHLFNG